MREITEIAEQTRCGGRWETVNGVGGGQPQRWDGCRGRIRACLPDAEKPQRLRNHPSSS